MISPKLYLDLYLTIITVLTLYCFLRYSRYTEIRLNTYNHTATYIPSLLLILFLIIFIGFRPLSGVFIDMVNYFEAYEYLGNNNTNFVFDWDSDNLIFNNLFNYLATNLYEIVLFFVIIASIYFICMFLALKKIFPNDLFYALIIYLGAFSTFSYATNGIKAGAAASIFLLTFAYYRRPILIIIFCLISLGFHHSMTLPIVAFVLAYFIKNPKYFYYAWLICLILSFFHITAITDFFAEFADEKGQGYLLGEEEWGGKTGFRWDFILYSLPPMLIGLWAIYKHHVCDRLYQLLLCTYIFVNGIWLLCMYVPYNNRIAYLSWFILPVVSIYPFFKFKLENRQYIQLNYVVTVYLAFTIFAKFYL